MNEADRLLRRWYAFYARTPEDDEEADRQLAKLIDDTGRYLESIDFFG